MNHTRYKHNEISHLSLLYIQLIKGQYHQSIGKIESHACRQIHKRNKKIKKQEFLHEDVLGDIIISVQKVEEQAKEYGHSFERELSYMVVHGFYHLMGYDHIEEKDKIIMRPKEENVLSKLGITREKE